MCIIVLVVCCKYHFWSCTSLEKKDPKTFGTKPAMKRSLKLLLLQCVLFFLSPNHLFKYFKRRYSSDQIACLNQTLSLRGKLNSVSLNLCFLRKCSLFGVAPKRIQSRVRKAKVYHSLKIEKAFLKDEIDRCEQRLADFRKKFAVQLRASQKLLSECDYLRFARLIAQSDVKQRERVRERNESTLAWLRKGRYGSFCVSNDTIINLSGVKLTDLQKDILCRGPHFGVPRTTTNEEVLYEFEVFYRQLVSRFKPCAQNAVAQCRSSLEGLAHEYANKVPDRRLFSLGREHMKTLKELRKNTNLVVTKPDKGNATVLMDRHDYVNKMKIILNDRTKFEKLGPSSSHDRTSTAEASLNKFLDELKDNGELSKELYDSLRSTGGTRPRMYGLPKVHKVGAPLRPILSMSGSPQYDTSKWLCKLLQPVRKKYSKWCIKDSFQFIDLLKKKKIGSNGFMCSFDVVSLFTKVPLEETIKICLDALYRDDDVEPEYTALSENSLCSLLRMVTSGVEFSFDDVMYRQTDGVAMGSPLGPVLADIFVGWCESRIPDGAWPQMYCRFVDDSFAHVDHRQDCERFLEILNSLHPALQFTCELENDGRLPYLDVSIEKSKNDGILTSIYRKPTFTGLYITWDSFLCNQVQGQLGQESGSACTPHLL